MLRFNEYLIEAETSLRGSLKGADSYKTISHVLRYVFPYMPQHEVQNSLVNLGKHVTNPHDVLNKHEQLPYAEERGYTHTLDKSHGNIPAGTPVKINGLRIDDNNRILASTEKHGEIPLTKVAKPPDLKKERPAKKAWGLETKIAKNLGGEAAGSSKEFYDFSYPPQTAGTKTKKKKIVVAGAVKKASENPENTPTEREVLAKGETKGHNGVMGNAKIFFDPKTRNWDISHSNPELAEHMKKAHVNGVPILQYLNKNHPDGIINKGFQATAPQGMTRKYLESIGSNTLHIHDLDNDVGTTFTHNDQLKGRTALGHLDDHAINSLDGIVAIGKTQNGNSLAFHRPNQKNMKTLAQLSVADPENHRDLSNAEHAKEFKGHIENEISRRNQEQLEKNKILQQNKMVQAKNDKSEIQTHHTSDTFGGIPFHSKDELL